MNEKDIMVARKKFETAYFIAKEELPLRKFKRFLALEKLHNVELGNNAYGKNWRMENLLIVWPRLSFKDYLHYEIILCHKVALDV